MTVLQPGPLTPARNILFQVFSEWFEPRGVHVFRANIGTPSPPCLLIGNPTFDLATMDGMLNMAWPLYAAVSRTTVQQFDVLDSILMGPDSVDSCLSQYQFEGITVDTTTVEATSETQYDAGEFYSATINLVVLFTP